MVMATTPNLENITSHDLAYLIRSGKLRRQQKREVILELIRRYAAIPYEMRDHGQRGFFSSNIFTVEAALDVHDIQDMHAQDEFVVQISRHVDGYQYAVSLLLSWTFMLILLLIPAVSVYVQNPLAELMPTRLGTIIAIFYTIALAAYLVLAFITLRTRQGLRRLLDPLIDVTVKYEIALAEQEKLDELASVELMDS